MKDGSLNKSPLMGIVLAMEIKTMSEFLVQLILRYPDLFDRADIPCALQGLWEQALEDQAKEVPLRAA